MSHGFLRSVRHACAYRHLVVIGLLGTLAVCAPRAVLATEQPGAVAPPDAGGAAVAVSAEPAAPQCAAEKSLAGREIAVDPAGGPRFGSLQFHASLPVGDKEVVLTFDDGPHPTRTLAVLDILDRYCIKAVFFIVGRM